MRKLFLGLAAILIGLSSCDLNTTKIEPTPPEISYYGEYNYSQYLFNDVVSQVLYLTKLKVDNPSGTADPEGVAISEIANNMMTIEYKETMSSSKRLGRIEVTFTGTPLAEGSSMMIHPNGLTYSGVKLSGDIRVDILAKGTAKAKQAVAVMHGALTDSYNASIGYSCNLTREQNEGESNKVDTDDTFTFTGSVSGTFSSKTSYSMTIDEPLILPSGSSYFKSGKATFNPALYSEPFSITFGKGQYVNQVLLTYKGVSKLYTVS